MNCLLMKYSKKIEFFNCYVYRGLYFLVCCLLLVSRFVTLKSFNFEIGWSVGLFVCLYACVLACSRSPIFTWT